MSNLLKTLKVKTAEFKYFLKLVGNYIMKNKEISPERVSAYMNVQMNQLNAGLGAIQEIGNIDFDFDMNEVYAIGTGKKASIGTV